MSVDFKTFAVFVPFLGAALIGFNYACNESVFAKLSIPTYIVIYCVTTIMVAVLFHFFTPEKIDFSVLANKSMLQLTAIAILASIIAWMFTLIAIKNVSANFTAIAELSYPFFTILFGYLLFGRSIHWTTILGGVLILSGSCILITGKLKSGG